MLFRAKVTITGVEFLISEKENHKGFEIALNFREDVISSEFIYSEGELEIIQPESQYLADLLTHAFASFMNHRLKKNIDTLSPIEEVTILSEDPESSDDESIIGKTDEVFSAAVAS
jgi:hypothetical protein